MSNRAGRRLDKYDVAMHGARLAGIGNLRMLEAVSLANADDDYVLHRIIRQSRQVNEEIADVNKRIRAMALENGNARIIMSMTGLDAFGALLGALEIDGIAGSRTPRSWCRGRGCARPCISPAKRTTTAG